MLGHSYWIYYGSITNHVGNIAFNNRYKLQFVEQSTNHPNGLPP